MRSTRLSPPAPRGRPRSQSARRAVLDAARELVALGGYPAATIEEIAARSGVAKTTIYRWWPNRPALAVDLLVQIGSVVAPPPSGQDPLRALRDELHRVAEAAEGLPGRLLLSLLAESQRDPAVRVALMKGLFNPRRQASAEAIRRAQASGALRSDVSPLIATDLLFGPLFLRRFIRQERVTGGFLHHVFEHFVAGLQCDPRSAKPGRRSRRAVAPRKPRTPRG